MKIALVKQNDQDFDIISFKLHDCDYEHHFVIYFFLFSIGIMIEFKKTL